MCMQGGNWYFVSAANCLCDGEGSNGADWRQQKLGLVEGALALARCSDAAMQAATETRYLGREESSSSVLTAKETLLSRERPGSALQVPGAAGDCGLGAKNS